MAVLFSLPALVTSCGSEPIISDANSLFLGGHEYGDIRLAPILKYRAFYFSRALIMWAHRSARVQTVTARKKKSRPHSLNPLRISFLDTATGSAGGQAAWNASGDWRIERQRMTEGHLGRPVVLAAVDCAYATLQNANSRFIRICIRRHTRASRPSASPSITATPRVMRWGRSASFSSCRCTS